MQVSRKKISDKVWSQMWSGLVRSVRNSRKVGDLEILLIATLAKNERIMMMKRLMVGVLTQFGWTGDEIGKMLKLSKSTVYKYVGYYHLDEGYRELLQKIFPRRIKKPKTKSDYSELGQFIEDIMKGKRERWRMYR